MTVQNIILNYLQEKGELVFGGTAEREASMLHKPATISRELRRMSEEGLILKRKVRYAGLMVVQYCHKGFGYLEDYANATML